MYQSSNIFKLDFNYNINKFGYERYAGYYLFDNSNDCCKFIKNIKVTVSDNCHNLRDFICIIYKYDKYNVLTDYEDILNKAQVIDIGVPNNGVYEFNKQDTSIDMQNKNLYIHVLVNSTLSSIKMMLCKNILYE